MQVGLPVTRPRKFRLLDLFSGIGGFSLAASWVWGDALEIAAFCEIDPYCQAVLRKHWPGVPIIGDVKDVGEETLMAYSKRERLGQSYDDEEFSRGFQYQSCDRGGESGGESDGFLGGRTIDLLTGGFPCQPFSCAGKRKGKADDRALWPEMLRVISEIRPRWVIGENVAGIINMELDSVLSDLEGISYETQAFVIPACAVNAPHRRDRVWIVAHTKSARRRQEHPPRIDNQGWGDADCLSGWEKVSSGLEGSGQDVADSASQRPEYRSQMQEGCEQSGRNTAACSGWWNSEPELCRMVNGFSEGLDPHWWDAEWPGVPRIAIGVKNRVQRLRALGNAIVPTLAAEIMRCIKEVDNGD